MNSPKSLIRVVVGLVVVELIFGGGNFWVELLLLPVSEPGMFSLPMRKRVKEPQRYLRQPTNSLNGTSVYQ